MFRDALPGETWEFDSDSSHVFLLLLEKKKYFKDDNSLVNFCVQQLGMMPNFTATPTEVDRILFDTLVADAREIALREGSKSLSCGHTTTQHLQVVEEWTEKNITTANKFQEARRDMENASVEERLWGKKDPR
ncbi:MAG: hypothetical protein R3346_00705 [Candidatus Spechtbacterales bacterium]|nr:hypothetical protein [Candidatus Spechtbacterales bacterium]